MRDCRCLPLTSTRDNGPWANQIVRVRPALQCPSSSSWSGLSVIRLPNAKRFGQPYGRVNVQPAICPVPLVSLIPTSPTFYTSPAAISPDITLQTPPDTPPCPASRALPSTAAPSSATCPRSSPTSGRHPTHARAQHHPHADDASLIREVPSNQEVWIDQDGFTSIIFDITERVGPAGTGPEIDGRALTTHLEELVGDDTDTIKVWNTTQTVFSRLG